MSDPNAEFDEKLRVLPKGSKKPVPPLPLPQQPTPQPVLQQTSSVALAVEAEQLREQLADAAVTIASRELEIKSVRLELAKLEEIVLISDRNYQHAVNETAEIRGVLKSLAAILINSAQVWQPKQDPPQVQS